MQELLHASAEICFELDRVGTSRDVSSVLRKAAKMFGAFYFLFGMRTGKSISPPSQIIISNYPKAWQRYYDEQGAHAFDPVVNKALRSVGAFRWDGLHRDERQLALRYRSVLHGMEFGFSCSDVDSDASPAILSFCGNKPIAPDLAQWERTTVAATLVTSATHKAVTRIVKARHRGNKVFGQPLNDAERRCLTLKAMAYTAREAAAEMKVQPRTIRYYLECAAEKLGVLSGREAVLKALSEGHIDIRKFPEAGFRESTDLLE